MLFSVADRGYVHFATDTQYFGEVKSYNNWITIFFTLLTNMKVDVGGQKRYVNKKEYIEHLKNRGISVANAKEIKEQGFDKYQNVVHNVLSYDHKKTQLEAKYKDTPFMRDHISEKLRKKQTERLFRALYGKRGFLKANKIEVEKAKQAIGCGADINAVPGPFLNKMIKIPITSWIQSCQRNIPEKTRVTFIQGETPFLRALRKEKQDLVHLLKNVGADTGRESVVMKLKNRNVFGYKFSMDVDGKGAYRKLIPKNSLVN